MPRRSAVNVMFLPYSRQRLVTVLNPGPALPNADMLPCIPHSAPQETQSACAHVQGRAWRCSPSKPAPCCLVREARHRQSGHADTPCTLHRALQDQPSAYAREAVVKQYQQACTWLLCRRSGQRTRPPRTSRCVTMASTASRTAGARQGPRGCLCAATSSGAVTMSRRPGPWRVSTAADPSAVPTCDPAPARALMCTADAPSLCRGAKRDLRKSPCCTKPMAHFRYWST